MKVRVEPEWQPKPEDEATKSNGKAPKQLGNVPKPDRKCNKTACKRQFVPASQAYGKKFINKPNQGRKPPPPNGNSQNKTQIRDVPSYIRTEMEILKHLRRVNHNLKILLKPECQCHKTPRDQKCCEPARNRKQQQALMARLNLSTQRSSSSKNNRVLTSEKGGEAIKNDAPNDNAVQGEHLADEGEAIAVKKDQQEELKDHLIQHRSHKFKCSKKCDSVDLQPPGPTQFQRFMLCFKPKRGGAPTVGESKGQAADGKFFHRKCEHHSCEKHLSTLTKRDPKVTFKPRRARQSKLEKKSATEERTLRQKMLGPCIKCLGKGGEPSRKKEGQKSVTKKDEKTTEQQEKAITTPVNAQVAREISVHASNQEPRREKKVLKEKESEKESEKAVAVAGVLQKCFQLFKPRKKESQGDDKEEKKKQSMEYMLRRTRERKSHDLFTTLNFFPKPSHVKVSYVEGLEEFKKNKAQPLRETCYYEVIESNMKTPTDTLSTSSLEEYFQRLSERMVRAQREADERKPPPRRKPAHQQPRRSRISS